MLEVKKEVMLELKRGIMATAPVKAGFGGVETTGFIGSEGGFFCWWFRGDFKFRLFCFFG